MGRNLESQKEILGGLKARTEEIAKSSEFIPPLNESHQQAIETSAKVVGAAIGEQIKKYQSLMVRLFTATGPLSVSLSKLEFYSSALSVITTR